MSKLPLTVKIPCWLLSIVLGVIILIFTKDFLLPIILAALLSLLLYPVYKKLTHWKVPSILSVFITMLVVVIIIISATLLISKEIGQVISDIISVSGKINEKIFALQSHLSSRFNIDTATITNWLNMLRDKLISSGGMIASGALSTTTGFLSAFLLVIVFVFCFLFYNQSFRDFAFALMKSERREEASSIITNVQKLVQHYLIGLLTVIFIIGTLNSIGLLVLGVDHAIFFAFFVALLTIIPYIGIFIGASLPFIYTLLTKDSALPAVGVLIVFFTVQFLESNFITPKIVGSRVSVNPFVAIFALCVGGAVWGPPGMILSIPLTAILKLLLDTRPNTKAFGYFLGSEFTDTKTDPFKLFGKQKTKQTESPKK